MKNNQFSRAVKRIPKKQVITQDFTGRSVVEDTYGFTILDAPVKVIEVDNKTSYTLQVVTDENTTGELENLILFENPIDDKIGHIITYNTLATTSETENEIVEAGIKEATTITTTDTNKGVISMHLTYYCKAYGTSKDCGGTDAATGCYQYWEMTVSSGGGDGAAGFGEPADAGNAEIGVVEGSGGNANPPSEEEDNTVVISPTHCPGGCLDVTITDDTEITEPCDELKKLGQNAEVSGALYQTQIYSVSSNIEKGYSIRKNIALATKAIPYPQNAGTGTSIRVPFAANQYGNVHCHPIGDTYQMFSGTDIFGLYTLSQTYLTSFDPTATTDLFVNIITTPGYDYAIKIDNPTKLATIAQYFTNPDDAEDFDEMLRDFIASRCRPDRPNPSTPEKVFLDFVTGAYDFHTGIGNFDFGISLYERPNNERTTTNNNWTKIELDENGNRKEIPCN